MDADRIIGAHLATHTPLQWLETLNRERQRGDLLQARLAAATEAAVEHAPASVSEPNPEAAGTCLEAVTEILQKATRK